MSLSGIRHASAPHRLDVGAAATLGSRAMVRQSEQAGTRAGELHGRALVVNGLAGGKVAMPSSPSSPFLLPQIMRAGGVTAANLTVSYKDGFATTMRNLSYLLRAIDASEEPVRVATTVDDIRAAQAEEGVAVILGFQNADPIEGSLEFLDVFHRLGLRIIQLTYQRRNLVADGCGEPA